MSKTISHSVQAPIGFGAPPPGQMEEGQFPSQQQMMPFRPGFDPLIMYGSIKVVDGLFITDEIAAHVRLLTVGPRVYHGE